MSSKRKIKQGKGNFTGSSSSSSSSGLSDDTLTFTPLGSGQEVGRSCHLLKFKGKTIMLDAGIHPGKKGEEALPFFDHIDPSEIDLLLITHFHLDHIAALPHFLQKTSFQGRVFMTHPTKAIARMLLLDYVRVTGTNDTETETTLYTEQDVLKALNKCETCNFHQQLDVDGIKFTAFQAGHVLGAAMFLIEIASFKILYTGDYSREDDRHLMAAECNPEWHPDLLIVESTFGIQTHESTPEREKRFLKAIEGVAKRGGKCLIPVFSLGRAQELLLIIDEHWTANPELQNVPVYYASKLADESLKLYKAFINMMNKRIRERDEISNPWDLQHIAKLTGTSFDESGPVVVFASPGMLQSGFSRSLFDRWCTDPRNAVIIAGYCVAGTLAKTLLSSPREVLSMQGRVLPLNCEVQYISFTAHSDFPGTYSFIQALRPKHTVLVHGEQMEMQRLKEELKKRFAAEQAKGEMDFFDPKNGTTLRFIFRGEKVVRVLGKLADECKSNEQFFEQDSRMLVNGILISHNFEDRLIDAEELSVFTQLSTTLISQRLHIHFGSSFDSLKQIIGKIFHITDAAFDDDSSKSQSSAKKLKVSNDIFLTYEYPPGRVLIEWKASPANDMIVDAIVALLMQAEGGVSGIKMSACHHHHQRRVDDDDIPDMAISTQDKDSAHDSSDEDTNLLSSLLQCLIEERLGEEVSIRQDNNFVLHITCSKLSAMDGNDASYIDASMDCDGDSSETKGDAGKMETDNQRAQADEKIAAEIHIKEKRIKCDDDKVKDILQTLLYNASQTILPLKFNS